MWPRGRAGFPSCTATPAHSRPLIKVHWLVAENFCLCMSSGPGKGWGPGLYWVVAWTHLGGCGHVLDHMGWNASLGRSKCLTPVRVQKAGQCPWGLLALAVWP